MAYNPQLHTDSNKSYGMGQPGPTDARSFFYDAVNHYYRPYYTTAEVNLYLTPEYRVGNFSIYIQPSPQGTGDTISEWWYKDDIGDTDLVQKGGGGGRFAIVGEDDSAAENREFNLHASYIFSYTNDAHKGIVQVYDGDPGGVGRVVVHDHTQSPSANVVFEGARITASKDGITTNLSYPSRVGDFIIPISVNNLGPDPAGNINLTAENLQMVLDNGAVLNKQNTIDAAGFQTTLHNGALLFNSPDGTGTVSIKTPGNSSFVKTIEIDHNNLTIKLTAANSEGGGGMLRRNINNFGELQLFSNKTQFGANSFHHAYITFYTGDSNYGAGGTAPTGTLTQRMMINGMGQVGIGVGVPPTNGLQDTSIDTSAAFQINSVPTTIVSNSNVWQQNNPYTGFLPPRLTTTQRDQIVNPAEGLMIYNNTTHQINYRDNVGWKALTGT